MAITTDPDASSVPLPAPTGPHPVGRLSTELVDADRPEIYSTEATDRRELVLWVWYPAEPAGTAEPATYLPAPWLPVAQFIGLDVEGLRTHAREGAPAARSAHGHPVLLLSPSGFSPLLLSAMAAELASHGYVVVGINPTYETTVTPFADGRVIPANPAALGGALGPQSGSHEEAFRRREQVCDYKAADLASVADHLAVLQGATGPLAGALDLTRLGAVGHSFGGNAALEWCRLDPRCLAAVNLDGALWTEVGRVGLDRPALQILAEHGEFDVAPGDAVAQGMAPSEAWFEAERAITFGGWATVDERARPGRTATIAGARHLSFMDVPFLPADDHAAITAMLASVTIGPERMWRVTSDLVLAFFAQHLDGITAALLDGDTTAHPEVQLRDTVKGGDAPGPTCRGRGAAPPDAARCTTVRKLLIPAVAAALALAACGSDDDGGSSAGDGTTTVAGSALPSTTLAPVAPTTYEGDGDETITITLPIPGSPAAATITNTVAGPFVVDATNAAGDVTVNLVDRIGTYEGTVPIDANTAQEKTSGLQIQAPGPWKIVFNALRALPVLTTGARSGTSDDAFLYVGPAQTGGFTFQGQGTAVLIAYPSISGGFPDTLASLDGASDTPANVQLPGAALIQVTAEGPWELQAAA